MDVSELQSRYMDSCRKFGVQPCHSILSSFCKVKLQKSHSEPCTLEIFLDQLMDCDFSPLIDVMLDIDMYEIGAVDILHTSPFVMVNGENILSLIRSINKKLHVVDIHDLSLGKDFLRNISQKGLACQVLNLQSSRIRKLNMTGKFMQLHTLNLDFSISLTNFQEECFNCMPRLTRLSLCETRISNLWTTCAALSKLPSLQELRFQNCLCCNDTGACHSSSKEEIHGSSPLYMEKKVQSPAITTDSSSYANLHPSVFDDLFTDQWSDDDTFGSNDFLRSAMEDSSDESEPHLASHGQGILGGLSTNPLLDFNGSSFPDNFVHRIDYDASEMDGVDDLNYLVPDELCSDSLGKINDEGTNQQISGQVMRSSGVAMRKYISHHPSPICFEKHYREYMVASLPCLKVLDNLPIRKIDRSVAKTTFQEYFEYLPYNRQYKENIAHILGKRELGCTGGLNRSAKLSRYSSEKGQHAFRRSISAAKVGSSAWPLLCTISRSIYSTQSKTFRPRQFEYHPADPNLMVFGTLDGELVVINHESRNLVSYLPSVGDLQSILGLCWLKKHPSKLIAGSDNGSLQLYDIHRMPSIYTDQYCTTDVAVHTFDEFEHLTSVHANSTDDLFLTSGYSRHVALYDIGSGRRIQILKDLHREHINVVKFAHHSPSIFATSSFDQEIKMWDLRQGTSQPCYTAFSSRGNVMVCYSPDDHYLLSSAVDNEVRQLLAADGRVHLKFNIAPTGSAQNYTRSYYMNGRDYIISGSCEENVVRICCALTGRRLRDVYLEGKGSRKSMFIQSLRGDPFRDFHMSILAAYLRPRSKSDIITVNLLAASGDHTKDCSEAQHCRPFKNMGG